MSVNNNVVFRTVEERRRGRIYHRVITGLQIGGNYTHLTLTSSYSSPEDIEKDFRKLLKRMIRAGIEVSYVKVCEANKRGDLVHFHVFLRGDYIDWHWVQYHWVDIHEAFCYVTKIYGSAQEAGRYVCKYLTKGSLHRVAYSSYWMGNGKAFEWRWLMRLEMTFESKLFLWRAHCKGVINLRDLQHEWVKQLEEYR